MKTCQWNKNSKSTLSHLHKIFVLYPDYKKIHKNNKTIPYHLKIVYFEANMKQSSNKMEFSITRYVLYNPKLNYIICIEI